MTLRMRVLPRFPATIKATNGITVERPAGSPNLLIKPDFGALVQIPNVGDADNVFFMAWDKVLGLYRIMSFADLFAGVADLGFMTTSVYDPQGIEDDAFDRANHTGTQAVSTVSGLQTVLDGKADAAATTLALAGKLALAGGAMIGPIENAIFSSPGANTKRAHFDLTRVTAGQDRDVIVPDVANLALSKWEVIGDYTLAAAASLDVINLSAFKKIRASGHIYPSATSAVNLVTSSNNGSSYDTGASDYTSQIMQAQSTTLTGFFGFAAFISLSGGVGVNNTVDDGITFDFNIENFNKASRMKYDAKSFFIGAAGNYTSQIGAQRVSTTARNAFRIAAASGTLTGNILVEGVRG